VTVKRDLLPGLPGFQGSETSGAEVVFYGQEGDPIMFHGGVVSPVGRRREDKDPSLISVSTSKQMGAASGQWSVTMKPPKGISDSIFDLILDDDWVDIVFYRHGRRWHKMRGLVDERRKTRGITGTGATTELFTITGRSFGKIWETTPIFFSIYTDDVASGGVSYQLFTGAAGMGNPRQAVERYLFGFLKALEGQGRANWEMPVSMPRNLGESFGNNVIFSYDQFTNDPPRQAINPNFLNPNGMLWQLAQEWSDPMFLELFTDQLPANWKDVTQGEAYEIDETDMYAILRDRPFPTIEKGKESPWFSLPMFEIPRQMVTTHEVGMGGQERYNAFFVSPQLTQTLVGMGAVDLVKPLWNKDDMLRHGLRRFDVTSKYISDPSEDDHSIATMSESQRTLCRDWYCLNPYMLSGTLGFGVGLPNLRIGTRLRIKDNDPDKDETYYVESVTDDWLFGQGIKTTAGVTRGWVGTDDSYMWALEEMADKYETPDPSPPADLRFIA
jgi:hypothetical protein